MDMNTTGIFDFPSIDIHKNPRLIYIIVSCVLSSCWLIIITFWFSRIMGSMLTLALRRFYFKSQGHIEIGSMSFSFISGKLMFSNIKLFTNDFSVKLIDGFIIFKWWRLPRSLQSVTLDDVTQNTNALLKVNYNVQVHIRGLQVHIYNRSSKYQKIFEIFQKYKDNKPLHEVIEINEDKKSEKGIGDTILSLISAIYLTLDSSKFIIGNRLNENMLVFSFSYSVMYYSRVLQKSKSKLMADALLMNAKNVNCSLYASTEYTGKRSKVPMPIKDGLTILKVKQVKLLYYCDEAGIVSKESIKLRWGLDLFFQKDFYLCYGPWFDRQRMALQLFFYPAEFSTLVPTILPNIGEKSIHTSFNITLYFECKSSMDLVCFDDNDNINIFTSTFNSSSCITYIYPWTVRENGTKTDIDVMLVDLSISTNLAFKKFLTTELLHIKSVIIYYLNYYDPQIWFFEFNFHKTSIYFLIEHLDFVFSFSNDWVQSSFVDLTYFIATEYQINIKMNALEIYLYVNDKNWIYLNEDKENSKIALVFGLLQTNFCYDATEFIAKQFCMEIPIVIEPIKMYFYIPESNTLCPLYMKMKKTNKPLGVPKINQFIQYNTHFNYWLEAASIELAHVTFVYFYTPIYALNPKYTIYNCLDVSFKELNNKATTSNNIIKITLGPMLFNLYGILVDYFVNGFMGNYLGYYDTVRNIDSSEKNVRDFLVEKSRSKYNMHLKYLKNLSFTLNIFSIKVNMIQFESEQNVSPVASFDKLIVEIEKVPESYTIQIIVTPINLSFKNSKESFLAIDGIFTRIKNLVCINEHLKFPVEYAFFMNIKIGYIHSTLTMEDLLDLYAWFDQFTLGYGCKENLNTDFNDCQICQHGCLNCDCEFKVSNDTKIENTFCPTTDILEFNSLVMNVPEICIFLRVNENLLNHIQIKHLEYSRCSKHINKQKEGFNVTIDSFYIRCLHPTFDASCNWMEVFSINVPMVDIRKTIQDETSEQTRIAQNSFVKTSDEKYKKLMFLWTENESRRSIKTSNTRCENCFSEIYYNQSKFDVCTSELLETACLKLESSVFIKLESWVIFDYYKDMFKEVNFSSLIESTKIEQVLNGKNSTSSNENIDLKELTEDKLLASSFETDKWEINMINTFSYSFQFLKILQDLRNLLEVKNDFQHFPPLIIPGRSELNQSSLDEGIVNIKWLIYHNVPKEDRLRKTFLNSDNYLNCFNIMIKRNSSLFGLKKIDVERKLRSYCPFKAETSQQYNSTEFFFQNCEKSDPQYIYDQYELFISDSINFIVLVDAINLLRLSLSQMENIYKYILPGSTLVSLHKMRMDDGMKKILRTEKTHNIESLKSALSPDTSLICKNIEINFFLLSFTPFLTYFNTKEFEFAKESEQSVNLVYLKITSNLFETSVCNKQSIIASNVTSQNFTKFISDFMLLSYIKICIPLISIRIYDLNSHKSNLLNDPDLNLYSISPNLKKIFPYITVSFYNIFYLLTSTNKHKMVPCHSDITQKDGNNNEAKVSRSYSNVKYRKAHLIKERTLVKEKEINIVQEIAKENTQITISEVERIIIDLGFNIYDDFISETKCFHYSYAALISHIRAFEWQIEQFQLDTKNFFKLFNNFSKSLFMDMLNTCSAQSTYPHLEMFERKKSSHLSLLLVNDLSFLVLNTLERAFSLDINYSYLDYTEASLSEKVQTIDPSICEIPSNLKNTRKEFITKNIKTNTTLKTFKNSADSMSNQNIVWNDCIRLESLLYVMNCEKEIYVLINVSNFKAIIKNISFNLGSKKLNGSSYLTSILLHSINISNNSIFSTYPNFSSLVSIPGCIIDDIKISFGSEFIYEAIKFYTMYKKLDFGLSKSIFKGQEQQDIICDEQLYSAVKCCNEKIPTTPDIMLKQRNKHEIIIYIKNCEIKIMGKFLSLFILAKNVALNHIFRLDYLQKSQNKSINELPKSTYGTFSSSIEISLISCGELSKHLMKLIICAPITKLSQEKYLGNQIFFFIQESNLHMKEPLEIVLSLLLMTYNDLINHDEIFETNSNRISREKLEDKIDHTPVQKRSISFCIIIKCLSISIKVADSFIIEYEADQFYAFLLLNERLKANAQNKNHTLFLYYNNKLYNNLIKLPSISAGALCELPSNASKMSYYFSSIVLKFKINQSHYMLMDTSFTGLIRTKDKLIDEILNCAASNATKNILKQIMSTKDDTCKLSENTLVSVHIYAEPILFYINSFSSRMILMKWENSEVLYQNYSNIDDGKLSILSRQISEILIKFKTTGTFSFGSLAKNFKAVENFNLPEIDIINEEKCFGIIHGKMISSFTSEFTINDDESKPSKYKLNFTLDKPHVYTLPGAINECFIIYIYVNKVQTFFEDLLIKIKENINYSALQYISMMYEEYKNKNKKAANFYARILIHDFIISTPLYSKMNQIIPNIDTQNQVTECYICFCLGKTSLSFNSKNSCIVGGFNDFYINFIPEKSHIFPKIEEYWRWISPTAFVNYLYVVCGSYNVVSNTKNVGKNINLWAIDVSFNIEKFRAKVNVDIVPQIDLLASNIRTNDGDEDFYKLNMENANKVFEDTAYISNEKKISDTKTTRKVKDDDEIPSTNPEQIIKKLPVQRTFDQQIKGVITPRTFIKSLRHKVSNSIFGNENSPYFTRLPKQQLVHMISDHTLDSMEIINEKPDNKSPSVGSKSIKEEVLYSIASNIDIKEGVCVFVLSLASDQIEKNSTISSKSTGTLAKFNKKKLSKGPFSNNEDINEKSEEQISIPLPDLHAQFDYLPNRIDPHTKTYDARFHETFIIHLSIKQIPSNYTIGPQILSFIKNVNRIYNQQVKYDKVPSPGSENIKSKKNSEPAKEDKENLKYSPMSTFIFLKIHSSNIKFTCEPSFKIQGLITIPALNIVFCHSILSTITLKNQYKFLFESLSKDNASVIIERNGIDYNTSLTVHLLNFKFIIYHLYGNPANDFRIRKNVISIASENFMLKPSDQQQNLLSLDVNYISFQLLRYSFAEKSSVGTEIGSHRSYNSDIGAKENICIQTRTSIICNLGPTTFVLDGKRSEEIENVYKTWINQNLISELLIGKSHQNSDEDTENNKTNTNSESTNATDASASFHNYCMISVYCSKFILNVNTGYTLGTISTTVHPQNMYTTIITDNSGLFDINSKYTCNGFTFLSVYGVIGGTFNSANLSIEVITRNPSSSNILHKIKIKIINIDTKLEHVGSIYLIVSLKDLFIEFEDFWNAFSLLADKNYKKGQISSTFIVNWGGLHAIGNKCTYSELEEVMLKLQKLFYENSKIGLQRLGLYEDKKQFLLKTTENKLHNNNINRIKNERPITLMDNIGIKEKFTEKPAPTKNTNLPFCNPELKWIGFMENITRVFSQINFKEYKDPNQENDPKSSLPMLTLTIKIDSQIATLSIFDGPNMRIQSWALFVFEKMSLNISSNYMYRTDFSTIQSDDINYKYSQLFKCSVGGIDFNAVSKESNKFKSDDNTEVLSGSIHRIESFCTSPPNTNEEVAIWLDYVHSFTSENDQFDVNNFRATIDRTSDDKSSPYKDKYLRSKWSKYKNKAYMILTFCPSSLDSKSVHDIYKFELDKNNLHEIKFSFITNFSGNLQVTSDLNLILFLREVFQLNAKKTNEQTAKKNFQKVSTFTEDNSPLKNITKFTRNYDIENYQLQPHFSLMKWEATSQKLIDVEWVLNQLGFTDAKTTIPIFFQTNLLDPLDELTFMLASLLLRIYKSKDEEKT